MKSLSSILDNKSFQGDVRNKYEFQAFGNKLAEELNDPKHRSLYIKLAKTEDRAILEQARDFVIGQEHVTFKGKLFMWKLKEIRKAREKVEAAD